MTTISNDNSNQELNPLAEDKNNQIVGNEEPKDSKNKTEKEDKKKNESKDEEKKKEPSMVNKLLWLATHKRYVYFHDQMNDPYVQVYIDNHHEVHSVWSTEFKRILSSAYFKLNNSWLYNDAYNNALCTLEAKALHDWDQHDLSYRICKKDDVIYYDLWDKEWNAVKIDKNGWNVVKNRQILFRRYQHQNPQVQPVKQWWDITKVFKYLNIERDSDKLLFLIYLVSLFIPDIPHPIAIFYWDKWASKSTSSRLIKRIADASKVELLAIPKSNSELVQILGHHWLIAFDNLTNLNRELADSLCRCITWDWISKRKLYTDDEDRIYSFRRCLVLNWINNIASSRSDLLDRSILFRLSRIEEDKRMTEWEYWDNFDKDLPIILWWVFDILARTLAVYHTVKLNKHPRMADFAVCGCAIAQALWKSQDEFINAYEENIKEQNKEIIENNEVTSAIFEFMEDKEEWIWSSSKLHSDIKSHDFSSWLEISKFFPNNPQQLSRKLNEFASDLKSAWMHIEIDRDKYDIKWRFVLLRKIEGNNWTAVSNPDASSNEQLKLPTENKSSSQATFNDINAINDKNPKENSEIATSPKSSRCIWDILKDEKASKEFMTDFVEWL